MDKKGGRDLRVQGMDAEEKDIQQGDAVKSCCIQCSLYCFALLGEGYSCCRRPFFFVSPDYSRQASEANGCDCSSGPVAANTRVYYSSNERL